MKSCEVSRKLVGSWKLESGVDKGEVREKIIIIIIIIKYERVIVIILTFDFEHINRLLF